MFSDNWIVASGNKSCHVEGRSNGRSSAPGSALSSLCTTVTIERGHADKGGDLLSGTSTQLRQLSQECQRRLRSDTRDSTQQVFFFAPRGSLFDRALQLIIHLIELRAERFANRFNALADQFVGSLLPAIIFRGEHSHELTPAGKLLLQFQLFFTGEGPLLGANGLSELREDPRVDGVGFREPTRGASEVSDLAWIDDHDGQPGHGQLSDNSTLVTTRSLQDDGFERPLGEVLDELLVAVRIVRPLRCAIRCCNIESVFGDINPNHDRIHEVVPSLPIRACQAAAQATVRAKSHKAGRDPAPLRSSKTQGTSITRPARLLRFVRYAHYAEQPDSPISFIHWC